MSESERLLNEKISGYFLERYRQVHAPDTDWIHDRNKTVVLIDELVSETGGIHLDMVAPGVLRCRTDRYGAVGGMATWGRTIAEAFVDFLGKRKVAA